ncbi:MAG: DUF547 domain-containing protein [Deltaproteobacteria bacterium]|nr:DUF547 domain-containing protein [Deltaproteobacteria bacterium]
MKKTMILLSMILCMALMITSDAMAADNRVDNSLYADLLSKYIKNGVVDYHGLKTEEKKLDAYLKILESADTKKMSGNERFAFYINAYNAWTIKLILGGYPGIKSIKDMGSFFSSPWKKKICRIDGKILTLDDIENNILRPKFKDNRVHFAINCASKSCPKLISKPYEADVLNKQLDASAKSFVNNPKKNYLKGNTLHVSSIFKWFAEDFNNDIIAFINKHAARNLRRQLSARSGGIKIKYLDYDWSLNGR